MPGSIRRALHRLIIIDAPIQPGATQPMNSCREIAGCVVRGAARNRVARAGIPKNEAGICPGLHRADRLTNSARDASFSAAQRGGRRRRASRPLELAEILLHVQLVRLILLGAVNDEDDRHRLIHPE